MLHDRKAKLFLKRKRSKRRPLFLQTKWRFSQALFPTVVDPVAMRAWVRGYVRGDTQLTICVKVWDRGLCGAKSQWLRRLRCRTQPGLSRCPSGLASLHHSRLSTQSPYQLYSFSGDRRVHFDDYGSFVYDSPNLFLWSIGFGSNRTHGNPVRTRAPDSPNLSNEENTRYHFRKTQQQ